ncbi:hypothetical protein FQA39_LY06078 [Lamprigera yunnana]|nr:hypothetical protein FQA39_LY06078 [Lamprigera yunnana]
MITVLSSGLPDISSFNREPVIPFPKLSSEARVKSSIQTPIFNIAQSKHGSPELLCDKRNVDFRTSTTADQLAPHLRDLDLHQSLNDNNYPIRRCVNVAKWNLKFSGNTAVQGVNSFIERVEELNVALNLSNEQLFREAVHLFEDQTFIWHRSIRKRANSWGDKVAMLRKHYLPRDYDEVFLTYTSCPCATYSIG